MNTVYIVIGSWSMFNEEDYIGGLPHDSDIHAVFDSEEKAFEYMKGYFAGDVPDTFDLYMNYIWRYTERECRTVRCEPKDVS